MLAGENVFFPPLTSASPRLLFDFPSRFNESLGLRKDPPRTPHGHLFFLWLLVMGVFFALPVQAQDVVEVVQLTTNPTADSLVTWEIRGAPATWLVTDVERAPVLTVTSPSGRAWERRAFLYCPYAPSVGEAAPQPIGTPVLYVRHTARMAGSHPWILRSAEGKELTRGTLTVGESQVQRPLGMHQISADNPRLLAFRDGTIFIPIGPNVCWSVAPDQLGKFERSFAALAKEGGTHVRLWCASWCGQIEGDQADAYRLDQAWLLDRILDLARQHGLKVTVVLDNHHDMGLGKFFPYGATYAERAKNFLASNPPEQYRRRLRYVLARWGADDTIAAWELFNEIDLAQPIRESALQWADAAAKTLKSLDVDHRLVTASWSGDDWSGLATFPHIDLCQIHSYVVEWTDRFGLRKLATRDGIGMLQPDAERAHLVGKPFCFSEVGYQGTNEKNPGNQLDTSGLLLRQQAWAGFLLGGYGSGMSWWWDVYIEPQELWSTYRGLGRILPKLNWRDRELSPLIPNRGSPLRIIGWQSSTQALIWPQIRSDTWYAHVVEGNARPQLTQELAGQLGGMTASASYRVHYLDMLSGEERSRREVKADANGTLELAILPPNLDVVVWVESAK